MIYLLGIESLHNPARQSSMLSLFLESFSLTKQETASCSEVEKSQSKDCQRRVALQDRG